VFLVNSCLGLFTAACLRKHPFSRSYGVILPSSLTMVLSLALGFSPHPPVSVCGTGTSVLASGFSRRRELCCFRIILLPITTQFHACGLPCTRSLVAWTYSTNGTLSSSFRVPASLNQTSVVQESLPVVHRLRLSSSA
jgi:hypothetical protein